MPGPGLIENLTPFQPGNDARRRPIDIEKAVRKLRKASPAAVDYCLAVLNDPTEDTAQRIKVALAIINKTIPDAGTKGSLISLDEDSIAAISLHVVVLRDKDQPQPSPVIEGQPEPSGVSLTFSTVTSGSGNDD